MANPSKKKGTAAETKVKNYFIDHGFRCERKSVAGSADEGDLRLYLHDGVEVTVEVKAGKQTWNYPRSKLEEWKQQTIVESRNSGCQQSILVIVRYRRNFCDTEVWIPNFQWWNETMPAWTMMYIDDFVKGE